MDIIYTIDLAKRREMRAKPTSLTVVCVWRIRDLFERRQCS